MGKLESNGPLVNLVWVETPLVKAVENFNREEILHVIKDEVKRAITRFAGLPGNLTQESLEEASQYTTRSLEVLTAYQQTISLVLKAMFVFEANMLTSAVETSLLSVAMAKKVGEESEEALEAIALGGFLHEVGVAALSFDPFGGVKLFSGEQRTEYMQHPKSGYDFLSKLERIPAESLLIVLQHHEWVNGRGFPFMLKDIYPPAKVVAVAAEFVYRTHTHMMRPGFNSDEALQMVCGDRGKFDPEVLSILVSLISDEDIKLDG